MSDRYGGRGFRRRQRQARRSPPGPGAGSDFWELDEQSLEGLVPAKELPGSVYFVPDAWWGFEAVGREAHPGACVAWNEQAAAATLLKGTTASEWRTGDRRYAMVAPDGTNGLKRDTAFLLEPRLFPERKVLLLHRSPRRAGTLAQADLVRLQQNLARVFAHPPLGRKL